MQVSAEDPERPWAEAGVYELAPDLYRIPLPLPDRGLHAVNVYAVVTEQGLALIDSGQATEDARAWLERALAALDRKPADVGVVYTTHMHVDHYTQGIRMRREHPVEIRLGEIERPSIERTMNAPEELPPTQEAALRRAGAGELVEWYVGFWRLGAEMRHLFELPDAWMRDGEILTAGRRRLEAVHTPGHTRGHLVFHDAEAAVMFTGDHVLPRITPSIGFEPVRGERPLADFIGSLHRVRGGPDAMLLPAHGPVAPSVHARVDELLQHHEQRLATCAAMVAAGASTGYEVAQRMTWTRREHPFEALDPFNRLLAIQETLAHLDVLADQGRLTRSVTADGAAIFTQ
jgi:glyoxylase-like metal-dependent hydrolase (beta-lactamase superfamily II)